MAMEPSGVPRGVRIHHEGVLRFIMIPALGPIRTTTQRLIVVNQSPSGSRDLLVVSVLDSGTGTLLWAPTVWGKWILHTRDDYRS